MKMISGPPPAEVLEEDRLASQVGPPAVIKAIVAAILISMVRHHADYKYIVFVNHGMGLSCCRLPAACSCCSVTSMSESSSDDDSTSNCVAAMSAILQAAYKATVSETHLSHQTWTAVILRKTISDCTFEPNLEHDMYDKTFKQNKSFFHRCCLRSVCYDL